MEEYSVYASHEELPVVCGWLLAQLNHSRANHDGFNDNDDDPLGSTEITVQINDDSTVSSDQSHLHAVQDSHQDNEEYETDGDDADQDVLNSFHSDIVSVPQEESSSDEDEQVVPLSPAHIYELILGEQLVLSVTDVVNKESEGSENEDEELEDGLEVEEADEEEGKLKKVLDKEAANGHDVEEETGNRSNPQPP